ncbi:RIP metalloprotease RseP [Lishizhenia sp.]|uniref:RIP metalloprotease RseP n=1 Tax=Lishizhenia sp. TaxID=2497594 RepID=UPI00299DFBFA|nr:RIP metalloprotease RseP [Lishizhenia sp.]MDX1446049.1 RIP metalloprotease RseP [Lishizhenia sp.]
MDILMKAAQLILSLSILIVLHEFGHFIPARLFKIRVEKFYLFFDAWFSLFKKKIGDTEWGIGWLPLGGYVKIAGMVDESMDKEQLAKPPQPDEFRAKPAWQRLIVMVGGVTVNVIVGFFIYIMIIFGYGESKITNEGLTHGLSIHPALAELNLNFRDGDKILSVEGEEFSGLKALLPQIWLRGYRELEVLHEDGTTEKITLPNQVEGEDLDRWMFQNDAVRLFTPRVLTIVDTLSPDGNAIKSDIQKGDRLIAINGTNYNFYNEFAQELRSRKDTTVEITLIREGDTLTKSVATDTNGTIGFYNDLAGQIKIETQSYSFGESISKGIAKGGWTMHDYFVQLKFIFTKKGASSMGGFGTIGSLFPTTWDWQVFWGNTAFISFVLAIMNILPIPALDGGHVTFLIYEIITGREAPQKVLEYAQLVGFVLILSLLIYANGNDIYNFIIK